MNSKKVTYNGETKTLSQWAQDFEITQSTFSKRIKSLGIAAAMLNPPLKRKHKLITFHGVTLNQAQWARKLGLSRSAFRKRLLKYGYERAITNAFSCKSNNFSGEKYIQYESTKKLYRVYIGKVYYGGFVSLTGAIYKRDQVLNAVNS